MSIGFVSGEAQVPLGKPTRDDPALGVDRDRLRLVVIGEGVMTVPFSPNDLSNFPFGLKRASPHELPGPIAGDDNDALWSR